MSTPESHQLHTDLSRAIGNLEGTVREGFKAVNQRLDGINGRIERGEKRIGILEFSDAQIKGKVAVIGGIAGLIFTSIGWFINWLIRK